MWRPTWHSLFRGEAVFRLVTAELAGLYRMWPVSDTAVDAVVGRRAGIRLRRRRVGSGLIHREVYVAFPIGCDRQKVTDDRNRHGARDVGWLGRTVGSREKGVTQHERDTGQARPSDGRRCGTTACHEAVRSLIAVIMSVDIARSSGAQLDQPWSPVSGKSKCPFLPKLLVYWA